MSSGDRDNPFPVTLQDARVILRFPVVERMMRRPITIDAQHWDIPYLAGYNENGDKIYIACLSGLNTQHEKPTRC